MNNQTIKQTYTCTACNYKFTPKSRTRTEAPNRCPYCGKDGHIKVVKHVLEEL